MLIQIMYMLFNIIDYLLYTCIYKYKSMYIKALTHNIYIEKLKFKMYVATVIYCTGRLFSYPLYDKYIWPFWFSKSNYH